MTVAPLRELGGPLVCKPDGGMAFALLSRRTPGASPKVGATCVAQTVRKEMKRTEQNRTGQDRTGQGEKKIRKTTPFGVHLMRREVPYRAAQAHTVMPQIKPCARMKAGAAK